MNLNMERPFSDGEIMAIRNLIDQLDRAYNLDDTLGRFAHARILELPIPLVLWANGHPLR